MTSLSAPTLAALRERLPATAAACVEAIVDDVPGYDRGFDSALRANIASAVQMALAAFLDSLDGDAAGAGFMRSDAYRLGQGEAETGRSTDALLAAYRVGAREAWTQFAGCAVEHGESAQTVASLATGTFAFIDELSAQSLAGHTAAMTARTRELSRRRDQLAAALVAGDGRTSLDRLAERAHWTPPRTLTALALTGDVPAAVVAVVGEATLWARAQDGAALALVPDLPSRIRRRLLDACTGTVACLGPSVPWARVHDSVTRARRVMRDAADGPVDAEDLLPELLLEADPLVAQRLRRRAMKPLADISEAKRAVLAETLLAWLTHHGRRDDVAAVLHVHPQTVRYRLNTLRELYGDALVDPRRGLELTLGLLANSRDGLEAKDAS